MSRLPAAQAEVILDVRKLRNPPTRPAEFAALWDQVEQALAGRDLRSRRVHRLDRSDGTVELEVARLADGLRFVSPVTRFSVVAVRERSRLRYRCRECGRYGPFVCAASSDDPTDRACEKHVSILDGALTATCHRHRPGCQECAEPATFRCAGPACQRQRAWCDRHRRPHPRDPDLDYCPPCYDQVFPRCETPRCRAIGSVSCEHISLSFEPCGRRMCSLHARRWQVFGGERLGLGRCSRHEVVAGMPPNQLLFQIVTGATVRGRRERLPSLPGLAHTLRNTGHPDLALDYRAIHQLLTGLARTLDQSGRRSAASAMRDMQPLWDKQLASAGQAAQDGARLLADLKRIITVEMPRHGEALTGLIRLAEYKPAVFHDGQLARPARLFVHVPEDMRGLFIGKGGERLHRYSERLGVAVEIEGRKRRR